MESGHVWAVLCLIFTLHVAVTNSKPRKLEIHPEVESTVDLWSFKSQDQSGVLEYRVPVIGPAPDGTLVAFSEARKFSSNDIGSKFLAVRRSDTNGKNWSATSFALSDVTFPDGLNLGEVANDKETKVMLLVYSHCPHTCNTSTTYLVKSRDHGVTWSSPVDLTKQVGDFVFAAGPGHGVQKVHPPHQGRIIFCGHGATLAYDGLVCICSDNHGYAWKKCAEIPSVPYGYSKKPGDFLPDENQVVELGDGTLLFTIRNQEHYHAPARLFARSYDGGDTINLRDVYIEERLPEPAVAGGMIYLEDYNLTLHSIPFNAGSRINMTLSWSYDDGITWNGTDNLQIWPGYSGYSCLTPMPNRRGHVGLLYERGSSSPYEVVTFVSINLHPTWKD